jgi:hypothetical protein
VARGSVRLADLAKGRWAGGAGVAGGRPAGCCGGPVGCTTGRASCLRTAPGLGGKKSGLLGKGEQLRLDNSEFSTDVFTSPDVSSSAVGESAVVKWNTGCGAAN